MDWLLLSDLSDCWQWRISLASLCPIIPRPPAGGLAPLFLDPKKKERKIKSSFCTSALLSVCLHLRIIIIIIIIIHTLHHISVERDRYVYGRPSENLSNDANKWYRSPPRFSASGYNFFCDSANNANMKIHFFFCLWYYTTVVLTDVYRLRSLSLCNVIPRFLLGSPSDPSAPCGSETLHVQNYTSRLIIISMKAKSIKALGHNKTFPLRIVSLSLSFRHIFLHFFFFFLALEQKSK
jgi:hypothetical protein